ncbi:MAG: FeoB-associated Cys-rich membrane protein [Cyclobacteriaceae bacterium]
MWQEIIVGLIFSVALGFLGRLVFRAFAGKPTCSGGCDSCDVIDVEAIAKQIESAKS